MALIMALGVLPAQVFALDGSSPEVSAPAAQQADQQQDQVAPDSATQAQPANDPNPQDQPSPDPAPQASLAEDAEVPAGEGVSLKGRLPQDAVAEATPVSVEVDGVEAIAAYDINIYADESQKDADAKWQPSEDTIQVQIKDGVLFLISSTLPAGTYQLREKAAPNGYQPLAPHIEFTISSTGAVTLGTHHPVGTSLAEQVMDAEPGKPLVYTLTVLNYRLLPSPSGLSMDVRPYLILAGAGAALWLVARSASGKKRREEK